MQNFSKVKLSKVEHYQWQDLNTCQEHQLCVFLFVAAIQALAEDAFSFSVRPYLFGY